MPRSSAARSGATANAVALAWVLAQPFPTIAVIGPNSVEHVRSSPVALDLEPADRIDQESRSADPVPQLA